MIAMMAMMAAKMMTMMMVMLMMICDDDWMIMMMTWHSNWALRFLNIKDDDGNEVMVMIMMMI